ncbi:helix-turn-helix transcriptional regulator [Maritalea porphyrae]|uniref:helix-turn-helix transcriptional regulator n=1 Tax=Maritalea porphyrae TaxID=880732 RepID=UPI0022B031F7|nr:helix-turn-helix transcriptional regulator [Maritalea porphyrae]MCZ4271047.1 helix-turn-helix transcriptional regulator [Maritalea porphyrae]
MPSEPLSLQQFSTLTRIIYQAAVDQSKWQEFVSTLALISKTPQSQMFGFDHNSHQSIGILHHNMDPEYLRLYGEYYTNQNFWAKGLLNLDENTVWHSDQIASREFIEQSEFYNDWLRPQEDILRAAAAIVYKGPTRSLMIGCNIRRHDQEDLEEDWMRIVAILLPHIRQAYAMSTIVGQSKLRELANLKADTGEQLSALIIVSASGNLIYANKMAQEILGKDRIIATGLGGAVRFVDVNCALQFRTALEGLKENAPNVSRICLDVDVALGPYEVRMAKLDPFDPPIPFSISIGEPALLVTIGRQLPNDNALANLQSKFSLTFAEAAVIDGFSAGKSLRAISEEKQVSIHTVRNQMKAAMAKLGVRSQIELMAFLQRL